MRQTLGKYQLGSYRVDYFNKHIKLRILKVELWFFSPQTCPTCRPFHFWLMAAFPAKTEKERERVKILCFFLLLSYPICQEILHILPWNRSKIHLLLPPPWLGKVKATMIFHLNHCNSLIAHSPCFCPCSSTTKQSGRSSNK